MKKILIGLLFLISVSCFGQATGYPIANKASGGSIGTAATTVDKYTIFNINQTTASQTLTIPNLTNNTSGKIIYINNTGTVTFNLSPYGDIDTTSGMIFRWEGLRWSLCGSGTFGSGSTLDTTYIYNAIGLKLNKTDTLSLSNRINLKENSFSKNSGFNKDTATSALINTPTGTGKTVTNYSLYASSYSNWSKEFVFDGQGSVISTGSYTSKNIDRNVIITGWKIVETSATPVSSTIDISLYKDTYANYPPTVADTANYYNRPLLSAATKNTATYTTPIVCTKGDYILPYINNNTGAIRIELVLIGIIKN